MSDKANFWLLDGSRKYVRRQTLLFALLFIAIWLSARWFLFLKAIGETGWGIAVHALAMVAAALLAWVGVKVLNGWRFELKRRQAHVESGAPAAVRSDTGIFIGTASQIRNQWVLFFLLSFAIGLVIRTVYGSLGIEQGVIADSARVGVKMLTSFWLVRGPVGELMVGKRLQAPPVAPAVALDSEGSTTYYPTLFDPAIDRAPHRQPVRQEGN